MAFCTSKDLQWAIDNFRYRHALLKRYRDEMNKNVIKPALDKGYDIHDISVMMFLRNLTESGQRKDMMSSLGINKFPKELKEKLLSGDGSYRRGLEVFWPIPSAKAIVSVMRTIWTNS